MKKIILLLIVLSIFSCSKEEIFEATQKDLTGTWVLDKHIFNDIDLSSQIEKCGEPESIKVDEKGNANWLYFLGAYNEDDEYEFCKHEWIRTLTFKMVNSIFFRIKDDSEVYFYQGRFKSKNRIYIRKDWSTGKNNEYTAKYEFIRK